MYEDENGEPFGFNEQVALNECIKYNGESIKILESKRLQNYILPKSAYMDSLVDYWIPNGWKIMDVQKTENDNNQFIIIANEKIFPSS